MYSTSIVKVIGAFVAGLVVALGSALIYVRVHDMQHAPPVEQAALPAVPAAAQVPDTQPALQIPAPEPARDTAIAQPQVPKTRVPVKHPGLPHLHLIRASQVPVVAAKPIETARVQTPAPLPATPDVQTPEAAPAQQSTPEPPIQEPPVQEPQIPQPHVVTLAGGTVLSVRLGETLSTDHNYTGDTFRATLLQPLIQDGFIIADRGSKVLGRIIEAQPAGHLADVAVLSLALSEINTTDGQRVRVATTKFETRGKSSVGEDAAKIAGGAALGAIIGGIAGGGKGAAIGAGAGGAAGTGAVLLSHGPAAVIQSETPISFRLANPVTITEKLN